MRAMTGALHFQISRLLVVTVISAVAATGALALTLLVVLPPAMPPPPGPGGLPPPPPSLRPLAVFPVVTGLFVLSWLAVLVVFARDQILRRVQESGGEAVAAQLADLRRELAAEREHDRRELAAEREHDLRVLSERLAALTAEYGEQRETDGYLHGMRAAAGDDPAEPTVRAIRRTPPHR